MYNKYGEGIPFERIRRITGYLVGDYRRMNNAKQAEVRDRVKHNEKENYRKDTIQEIETKTNSGLAPT